MLCKINQIHFSPLNVCSNPCFEPLPKIGISFFRYQEKIHPEKAPSAGSGVGLGLVRDRIKG